MPTVRNPLNETVHIRHFGDFKPMQERVIGAEDWEKIRRLKPPVASHDVGRVLQLLDGIQLPEHVVIEKGAPAHEGDDQPVSSESRWGRIRKSKPREAE